MQNNVFSVLFLGDIVGNPGRKTAMRFVESQKKHFDCILANGENASGGKGITPANADELFFSGIHGLTSGNHIWHKKELICYIDESHQLIRPLNYPPGTPGQGYMVLKFNDNVHLGVINILGRVFMDPIDCPFRAIESVIDVLKKECRIIIVDFHAEASSEKRSMGFFLDGKVSAVLGTHTHVQSNDFQILPKGTAYITDVGMTGPHHSVIGVDSETIIQRYLSQMPDRFEVSKDAMQRVDFVELHFDTMTGKAISIKGCHEIIDE